MTNPDIFLFGIRIAEPVTTGTDLLAAAVALAAGIRLWRTTAGFGESVEQRLFSRYFILLGLATLISAFFGHAFRYAVHDMFRLFGWALSGVAVLFAELATNRALLDERAYSHLGLFALIPWIQVVLFLFILVRTLDFRVVQQNSVIGLIFYVLPLQYLLEEGSNSEGRRIFMSGIVLGILPAIVYSRQIALSQWFNHHDLSHTLFAVVIHRMYRGISLIGTEQVPGYERPSSL